MLTQYQTKKSWKYKQLHPIYWQNNNTRYYNNIAQHNNQIQINDTENQRHHKINR